MIIAAVILVTAVVSVFVFKPMVSEIEKVNKNIEKYTKILKQKEREAAKASTKKQTLMDLENKFNSIKESFFVTDRLSDFIITELVELAEINNVEVSSIAISPMGSLTRTVSRFPVGIRVTGRYRSLKQFIVDLENHEKGIILADFNLVSSDGPIKTKLDLELLVYNN